MFASIASLFAVLNSAYALLKNLFGAKPAPDENTQAVEVANKVGAITSTESRTAAAAIDQALTTNATTTSADVAATGDADSLSDGAASLDSAIARTDSHAGSDS